MLTVKADSLQIDGGLENRSFSIEAELSGAPCRLRGLADQALAGRYGLGNGDLPFRVSLDQGVQESLSRLIDRESSDVSVRQSDVSVRQTVEACLSEELLTTLEAELDAWAQVHQPALTGPTGPRPIVFIEDLE